MEDSSPYIQKVRCIALSRCLDVPLPQLDEEVVEGLKNSFKSLRVPCSHCSGMDTYFRYFNNYKSALRLQPVFHCRTCCAEFGAGSRSRRKRSLSSDEDCDGHRKTKKRCVNQTPLGPPCSAPEPFGNDTEEAIRFFIASNLTPSTAPLVNKRDNVELLLHLVASYVSKILLGISCTPTQVDHQRNTQQCHEQPHVQKGVHDFEVSGCPRRINNIWDLDPSCVAGSTAPDFIWQSADNLELVNREVCQMPSEQQRLQMLFHPSVNHVDEQIWNPDPGIAMESRDIDYASLWGMAVQAHNVPQTTRPSHSSDHQQPTANNGQLPQSSRISEADCWQHQTQCPATNACNVPQVEVCTSFTDQGSIESVPASGAPDFIWQSTEDKQLENREVCQMPSEEQQLQLIFHHTINDVDEQICNPQSGMAVESADLDYGSLWGTAVESLDMDYSSLPGQDVDWEDILRNLVEVDLEQISAQRQQTG